MTETQLSKQKDVPEEWLTITQGAAQLGISERTLYRLLKSDNFAGRTLTEHRQTATGRRLTTLLPQGVVQEIAQAQRPPAPLPAPSGGQIEPERENADNNAANGDTNAGRTPADDDSAAIDSVPAAGTGLLPAVVYQARIADLEALNAELRADKERLYQLLEAASANLAREQTLRALPQAPDAWQTDPPEAPGPAPEDTESSAAGDPGMVTPAGAEQGGAERQKAALSWWGRLWWKG